MTTLCGRGGLDSRGLDDLARSNTTGAGLHEFWFAVDHRADALDVRQPAPFGHVVGVGDIAPRHGALAADFTSLRHFRIPPHFPHVGVELNSTGGVVLQVSRSIVRQKIAKRGADCVVETVE